MPSGVRLRVAGHSVDPGPHRRGGGPGPPGGRRRRVGPGHPRHRRRPLAGRTPRHPPRRGRRRPGTGLGARPALRGRDPHLLHVEADLLAQSAPRRPSRHRFPARPTRGGDRDPRCARAVAGPSRHAPARRGHRRRWPGGGGSRAPRRERGVGRPLGPAHRRLGVDDAAGPGRSGGCRSLPRVGVVGGERRAPSPPPATRPPDLGAGRRPGRCPARPGARLRGDQLLHRRPGPGPGGAGRGGAAARRSGGGHRPRHPRDPSPRRAGAARPAP